MSEVWQVDLRGDVGGRLMQLWKRCGLEKGDGLQFLAPDGSPLLLARVESIRSSDEAQERSGRIATLAEVRRQHMLRALKETGWDVQEAAKLLGIGKSTLYRTMSREIREGTKGKKSR